MASQGSDKLKAILAQALEKARAAQAARAAEPAPTQTQRVEALLDRNEALPDSRALARLYRSKDLVERLPDDEDSPTPQSPAAAELPPVSRLMVAAEPKDLDPVAIEAPALEPPTAPSPDAAPSRPPLSPAQIREVMKELQDQFTSNTYMTYEAKPRPVDVIPMPEVEEEEETVVPMEEPNEAFYVAGALIALLVIGVFFVLALNGPLRYRPPASGPGPSPSASAPR